MALLRSATQKPHPRPTSRPNGKEPTLSILAAGTRLTGELETDGVLRIEGKVQGNLRALGQVLVGTRGVVEGDIVTREAIIGGQVRGQILADVSVTVQAAGTIDGDITTPRIVVAEGGKVNGYIRTANPETLQEGQPPTQRQPTDRPDRVGDDQEPKASRPGEIELLRSVG